MTPQQKEKLLKEVEALRYRHQLADTVGPDYFEPGMMEHLAQSDGYYDPNTGRLMICFESQGLRYNGRTEQIEKVRLGDEITVVREKENYDSFLLLTKEGHDVGDMPTALCNAVAPLLDEGSLTIERANVSFVAPISKRSRYARQAVLFVKLEMRIVNSVES